MQVPREILSAIQTQSGIIIIERDPSPFMEIVTGSGLDKKQAAR